MFAVNETTGEISLTQDIFITSNSAQRLEVALNVSDSGMPVQSNSAIAVLIVISSVPEFPQDVYTFEMRENQLGSPVGVVAAMDRDINQFNDIFIYSILIIR